MGVVRIIVGAVSEAVCELEDVKDELGIDPSDTSQDAKLDRIIASVGSAFAGPSGLNRPPWRQEYSEQLSASGGFELRLERYPIEEVLQLLDPDGAEVDPADYETYGDRVEGPDRLYRDSGWRNQRPRGSVHLEFAVDFTASYVAGWLMAGQVSTFLVSEPYALGDWVRATDASIVERFICTTAGTSGPTEDPWNASGDTTQGSAIFTAKDAREWPEELENAAINQSSDWFRALALDPAIASESFETMRTAYRPVDRDVSNHVTAILKRYR